MWPAHRAGSPGGSCGTRNFEILRHRRSAAGSSRLGNPLRDCESCRISNGPNRSVKWKTYAINRTAPTRFEDGFQRTRWVAACSRPSDIRAISF